ncbi:MAG: DNA methyltransferase [Verrucomicrobiota bacterium]|nr:DNA methyltransferase [Verrucomicrobiota bacterium]
MSFDKAAARQRIQNFDFSGLFTQELGWDWHRAQLPITLGAQSISLQAVAQKRGFVVWHYAPAKGAAFPDSALRRRIEREVTKGSREHLIIYTDAAQSSQIWQWVRRELDKSLRVRDTVWYRGESEEPILQKLTRLFFSFGEEETLTLVDVSSRAAANVDERIVKRFYGEFREYHKDFLSFITGIPNQGDHEWYASLMLNRLMFLYFIQRKGFLAGDIDYLQNRLTKLQTAHGKDKFYTFYRFFLIKLFHGGLNTKQTERLPEMESLLGRVPYLNGGIFDEHILERTYHDINISDVAFKAIFDFFGRWNWHLDERPLKEKNEINPDVLGYIFEKYINQKQMGAYYTKEDITGYIGKNTIIPFIFDAVKTKVKDAFEGKLSIWSHLKDDPERYIYKAVRHGVSWNYIPDHLEQGEPLSAPLTLPQEIAVGIDTTEPNLIERRKDWNKPSPAEYGLPTEIWRETVERRQRYTELRGKLAAGEVHDISELITLNLDIQCFAQDVISRCDSPELLAAFWHTLAGRLARNSREKTLPALTILDPTCGSGAFLFAALNILEPLYAACLDRMECLMADVRATGNKIHPDSHLAEFENILKRVEKHPNERYFIFKTIILHNLYGVDLMEEAVEICKLRLFLKLAAQVEPDTTDKNLGIEPLPDIDFNIRAGNTLVGYSTRAELETIARGDWLLKEEVGKVINAAEDAAASYNTFVLSQLDGENPAEFKQRLNEKFGHVRAQCDSFLAESYEYGLSKQPKKFGAWKQSHQPFHWFVEFFGILNSGGFDVIIGNPPYLEIREVDYDLKNYTCSDSGAIHAMCMEQSERLLHKKGCMSMIVPLSLPSTQRMQVVQELLEEGRNAWFANYAWRPAKLFDTVNRALTIFVVTPSSNGHTFSTNYQKWTSDNRQGLMERLNYVEVLRKRPASWIPKLGHSLEQHILNKCLAVKTTVIHFVSKSDHRVYYRTTGGLYWKVFTDFAPAFNLNGKKGHSSRETWFTLANKDYTRSLIATLSSNVFWWWYTVTSNLRDLNPFDIQNYSVPISALADPELQELGVRYLNDLVRNSTMLVREQKNIGTTETQSFKIQKSKPILDEIDTILARHYGFTEEELDFIINYDIKYRLGRGTEEEE